MKNSFPFAYIRGKIVPTQEATVNIMTNALQYGTGVFGGIRGYEQDSKKGIAIFRLDDHIKRLLNAVSILGCESPITPAGLKEIILTLAKKNAPKSDFYMRPFIYASDFHLSPDLSTSTMELGIYVIPLGEYLPIHKGLNLMVSSWTRISDSSIPARAKVTGGYVNSALARGEAVKHGYDDALMISSSGHISEASAANFFIVRDGVLITTPKYTDILEGITRKTVLQLAHDLNIKTEERDIDRTEVYIADEAFLSGTGAQVAWVGSVDRRLIGAGVIGPVTKKLQDTFFSVVRGKVSRYASWLTSI